MQAWKFERGEWGYYSSGNIAFNYSPEMIEILCGVCEFDSDTDAQIRNIAVSDGPLIKLIRHNSEAIIATRANGTTLTPNEQQRAIEFAEEKDLFSLSDDGIFEVGLG